MGMGGQGSTSPKTKFSHIKNIGKEYPQKIGPRAASHQHTGSAGGWKLTGIQESVAYKQMKIYWTTLAKSLKLSWAVVVNALKNFLKSKFPKSRGSYVLGIIDKIANEILQGGWTWFWAKVHKAFSASFWAATAILFNSMKTSTDRTITLYLPGSQEGKAEEGESQVLKAVKDEFQKLSRQQADGLAEGFKSMQKVQSTEWRLIRQELSMLHATVGTTLPRNLVIKDVVNPDNYVPLSDNKKSETK